MQTRQSRFSRDSIPHSTLSATPGVLVWLLPNLLPAREADIRTAFPLAVIILLLAVSSLPATTYDVGPGGSIQAAVDAAATGDLIRVTNGVYAAFTANKAVMVRSRNGASVTVIDGTVRLDGGACLSGFTVKNGDGNTSVVLCWNGATNAFVTNCVISGGHVPGGNGADGVGGGATGCTLYNCLLTGNWASYGGGGAAMSTLYNCTVASNSVIGHGGGVWDCTLYNCIVCSNTANAPYEANCDWETTLHYSFTDADPLFVDCGNGNFRLQPNSPCINAGNNAYAPGTKDLDGRTRTVDGTVDMGAYEFQPGLSGAFIGWLQYHGLRTSGSDDYTDPDHDGLNNWQEWVCGTCPTNPASALRLLSATPRGTNVMVAWESVAGTSYLLTRSASLASPFTLMATNITGQAGTTSYADTNATGAGPFYYRVGVQCP